MSDSSGGPTRRAAAIALLRDLRRLDDGIGVRHSGIARDVALLLYEAGDRGLSVNQISAGTGYSGPTIRLVLERLMDSAAIALAQRQGKTQFYCLTQRGNAGCDGYVDALFAFAEAQGEPISPPAEPAPVPDPPADRPRPRAPHGGGPSRRGARE